MINEIFSMNGYGLYVWSAFAFTLINFASLFLITKLQLLKEKRKFTDKFGSLDSEKLRTVESQQTNRKILEDIKNLPFDYYQIYDCSSDEIRNIKKHYNKKIITAFTIETSDDVKKYNFYKDVSDIFLFDSGGYEKSMSFEHLLLKDLNFDKEVMLAGDIKVNDNLENFNKIADIIDISGGLETSGLKDISKIEIFLKKIKEINDEN